MTRKLQRKGTQTGINIQLQSSLMPFFQCYLNEIQQNDYISDTCGMETVLAAEISNVARMNSKATHRL